MIVQQEMPWLNAFYLRFNAVVNNIFSSSQDKMRVIHAIAMRANR
jgi:phosphatidate phosphatase APP1